ncbi:MULTISPECIES: GAF domain-containing protein [Streptomyces violaceusniger group]|uniref:GAF domain-containing protein n=1 Tax=Streptomyces rhizosphaericus TaxID=114699 RepID=A0ABN1RXJ9_9ACTN|nr:MULTISPECIES: GAF domain-containing protein [Streptomyces violaceusniger group]
MVDECGHEPRDTPVSGVLPQLRLDELLEGLQQQVAQVRSARDRIHTLLDAVLVIGSDLELEVVLQRIVESAVSLVDAEYGALGVLGEEGTIKQFLTVGIDEETIAGIGHYPRGEGILGLLIRHPEPLRLANLARHPSSVGFPSGHPPMTSFLGTPIKVREQVFGNLYLTDKQGATEFDADDEAVLRTLAAAAGVAIDNARLYDDARRRQRWLAASNELTRSLLSGTEPAAVLESFTATLREMAGADLVTLAIPVGDSGELVIEAASGPRAEDARGLVLGAATLAAKVFASGETITSDAVSADPRATGGSAAVVELGPAFLVPLGTRDHVRGVLQVANVPGGPVFTDAVIDMVIGYGNQAALALEVAEHRQDADRMLVLNDRDRIARDLHDLVIQRLFAGAAWPTSSNAPRNWAAPSPSARTSRAAPSWNGPRRCTPPREWGRDFRLSAARGPRSGAVRRAPAVRGSSGWTYSGASTAPPRHPRRERSRLRSPPRRAWTGGSGRLRLRLRVLWAAAAGPHHPHAHPPGEVATAGDGRRRPPRVGAGALPVKGACDARRIYREEADPDFDGATEAGTPYCAPGTPGCDADYDYATRPPDALLPIGRDSDVYARMVRQAGRGALLRYYRVEDGTHVDSLVDTFPDKLRPMVPCHRSAFEALERWLAGKGRPPADHTVRRPADADPATLLTSCPLD